MTFVTPRLALFFLFFLLADSAVQAQPRSAEQLRSLSPALGADGALRPGTVGSFDASGFRLATGEDGQPRFLPGTTANDDERWDDRFNLPGVLYGPVSAVALGPDGDLYVGGYFFSAGGVEAANVARWDGRRWWPLGGGTDGEVRAIVVAGDDVFVGGSFSKAGDVLSKGVARWDGARWHSLAGGLEDGYASPGKAYALAYVDGTLYVGGTFVKAGTTEARGLAAWDGMQWREPGGGVLSTVYSDGTSSAGTVYALAPHGDELYVGGQFGYAGQQPARSIARLHTGTGAWSALGEGLAQNEYSHGTAYALAVDGDDLYVGGDFVTAGTVTANGMARWDGAAGTWSTLGSGLQAQYGSPQVRALAFVGETLYVGGAFIFAGGNTANAIATWQNGAWSPVVSNGRNGLDSYAALHGMVASQGQLYVVGDFDTVGDVSVNNVTRWDPGTQTWNALGEGVSSGTCCGYVQAVAVAPGGDVYVGGYFEYAGSVAANNIAHWDGTRWHALGEGIPEGTVYALAVIGDDVYVGGSFTSAGGRAATNVARWNRATRSWHALGNGVNGAVYALAADGATLLAGGDFTAAGNVDAEDVARWDGTAWSRLGQGVTFSGGSRIQAIVASGGTVFLGGDFSSIKTAQMQASAPAGALVVWDSATDKWYGLGAGLLQTGSYGDYAGDVRALALIGNDVYVGGNFDKANTIAAHNIARFNFDTGWAALGSNVGGDYSDVNAMAVHGTDLYVGGAFTTAGNLTVNGVARWDGAAWAALGSGLLLDSFDEVSALAVQDADLYVGGDFLGAGGGSSHNFAHWSLDAGVAPVGQAAIAVDPVTVEFGEVAVGQPEVLMITISNTAGATATLSGTIGTPTGPFRVTEGGGAFALAPGASHAVIVAFEPTAAGAVTGTLSISHNAPNLASPVAVTLRGSATGQGRQATLRNFDPAGPQIVWTTQDGHFVFGTNKFGDRAKATLLTPPSGKTGAATTIDEVRVWFGYRAAQVTNETYTLHLHSGTAASGPAGAPLHSQTFRVADVRADADPQTTEEATVHVLSAPVTVTGPFFVTVDFGAYANQQLLAVAAGSRLEQRVSEVWEQWSDGSWHNVSDAWTGAEAAAGTGTAGWHLWIEAGSVTPTGTAPGTELPAALTLDQNYPNPFNPATVISYALDRPSDVRLRVYDLQGRLVRTLVEGVQAAGTYAVSFDAGHLPSGTYFYRLETPHGTRTRHLTLVR